VLVFSDISVTLATPQHLCIVLQFGLLPDVHVLLLSFLISKVVPI